jgi:hypothetical protein
MGVERQKAIIHKGEEIKAKLDLVNSETSQAISNFSVKTLEDGAVRVFLHNPTKRYISKINQENTSQ